MLNKSPLPVLVHDQARRYGNRVAMRYRDDSCQEWRDISWNTFSQRVYQASNAMLALGVKEQENMAVFSQNMPEGMFVDFAAYGIRAVTIPFYATSSEMQVKYMVSDASVRIIFVGEQYQYDTAFRVLKMGSKLERLIIFDRSVVRNPEDQVSIYFDEFLDLGCGLPMQAEVKRRTAAVVPEDLANILYTSGTTGLSKGVMLTHLMYSSAIKAHEGVLPLTDTDVILNFLPFTHVFERGWAYLCIANGCTLAINRHPEDVLRSMREVHPTCMCAVPRFWEKVYAGVQERMDKSSPIQRRLLQDALDVGYLYNVKYRMKGLLPPVPLRVKYAFYEKTVIALLKKELGLERAHFFPTAGAAISQKVEEFVRAAGIVMIAGYGLTESTATVSCDRWNRTVTPGSVGRVLDSVEIKFGENNEVLLRGNTITKGYYRKAEVTELSIDGEGWFHTGDAGYMKDGELFLTDRIKDMFKTSNGKYIAPQLIESKLCVDRFIDQIVVIAEGRKFVSALIIPQYDMLREIAEEKGLDCKTNAQLCAHPEIVKFMKYRIDTMQQEFAHYEQVKKIALLPEPLSLEKGELTNTLKVRRQVLNEHYKDLIDKMYEE